MALASTIIIGDLMKNLGVIRAEQVIMVRGTTVGLFLGHIPTQSLNCCGCPVLSVVFATKGGTIGMGWAMSVLHVRNIPKNLYLR